MDTDLKNTNEDAEMADCDGEKVVTMMDVLQEQEEFEEDVNAVLGASDDKNCTYSKGYIKRQAIYACMTCCSEAKDDLTKRAGVCLACSLTCHENHDLIELYTKRNFKCDCGNPKFNSHPCQFTADKSDLNEENNYNQNFSGVYCVCQRPYPDPESTIDIEMIQCIICEDWLHVTHLEGSVPDNDQYSEMICKVCMDKNDFLHDYSDLAVNIEVDVVTNGIDTDNKICNGDAEPVKVSDNITISPKVSINKTNGENMCDTKESANEENDDDKSVDTPSGKDDTSSSKLGATETAQSEENKLADVTEDNIEEEITKDNCLISENTHKDVDNQNESSDNEEQQNKNKDPTSNSEDAGTATEPEKKEILAKSAEQKEEQRLLAEPDDDNSKLVKTGDNDKDKNNLESTSAADEKNTNKTDSEIDKTLGTEEIYTAKVDNENKQNESQSIEGSTDNISEKELGDKSDENSKKDGMAHSIPTKDNLVENCIIDTKEAVIKSANQNGQTEVQSNEKNTEKRKLSTEENSDPNIKKAKLDEPCVRPKGVGKVHKGATFWPTTLRQKLCTCRECITMYKDLSVLFLIDPEDTVTAYENLGKQKIDGKPVSQYEKGLEALSSLDRIQQINALTEYNKMRDKLLDFLKSFKDRREVVKEEDIKAFFAGMKPKREPDGVYFCR
ncbi:putative E3 ubiquitin-protein ligase UBR7 [Pararge aegeria]|uniref:putative E3 ubiquitin-protein ligase UBR7 n=1 Tax=Pararge aegeria TaxID=116150 RepID=UPI0019D158E0|nr:putative E3 ubiquitin-protein ligase UBR7 [Pararge aegeria]